MIAVRTPLTRADIVNPAGIRAGIERRIPMSAGRNNTECTPTAAVRVDTLVQLAKEHHCGEDIWVTRKGAIKATRDSWAMIPGSMGRALEAMSWSAKRTR